MGGFVLHKRSVFSLVGTKKKIGNGQIFAWFGTESFSLCQNKTLLFRMFSYLDVQETDFEFVCGVTLPFYFLTY